MSLPLRSSVWSADSDPGTAGSGICLTQTATFITTPRPGRESARGAGSGNRDSANPPAAPSKRATSSLSRATIDRVGALVEQPSFFPNFTGRRNLELLGRTRRIGPKRVDGMLDRVGLGARADTRFATYSLGMKQRLGIAAALLKDPELLILDEPANGLDPPGILEVRTLMRTVAAHGRTVFVSSHILSEVEHACDRIAIVAHGKCIASGRVSELLQGTIARYRVRVDDPRAQDVLAAGGWTVETEADGALV